MESSNPSRLKGLLSVLVRRHVEQKTPVGPLGKLVAEEKSSVFQSLSSAVALAPDALRDLIVDRIYSRYFLNGQPTVALASLNLLDTRLR